MFNEAHYEAALNYFYFLLMDEGTSLHCALRAVKAVQNKIKNLDESQINQTLIREMSLILRKAYKKSRPLTGNPAKSDWNVPNNEFLGSWKEYLRRSEPDSAEALVLRYILGYPVSVIAKALLVPDGTIYFRLGRGLEGFSGGHL